MNLSKIFLVNFFVFFVIFYTFSQETIQPIVVDETSDVSSDVQLDPNRVEYYRSNSNGLMLVQIKEEDFTAYKFVLRVDYENNLIVSKKLYKGYDNIKQWEYQYNGTILEMESYLKDGMINQQYFYDCYGHKIQEDDFKNNEIIKSTSFSYNKEGLVDQESAESKISNQITQTRYKYDSLFRIKQIEKTYPDGSIVYWESFLSDKGILTKEYYTLKNEVYSFWYNQSGQETAGEIKEIIEVDLSDDKTKDEKNDKKEKETKTTEKKKTKEDRVKFKWENFYISKGLREQKIEENFDLHKKVITNYNKDGKETKVQTYFNDEISKIEYYDYDDKKHIIYYKIIEDLKKNEVFYRYGLDDKCIYEKYVENDKIQREINYFVDGSREEIIYTSSAYKVKKKFDAENNLINTDLQKDN